jgi:hypothetical protein
MKIRMKKLSVVSPFAGLFAAVALPLSVWAAPITPGNLIVYRVGDGTAALSSAATAVFLDEYTQSGSLVQSIALPTSGSAAFTATGNATTEGIMSFSQNGAKVLFTGYRKNVGGTNPSADSASTTPRVIGVFDPTTGTFDTTSFAVINAGGTIRSATSTDGSSLFYIASSSATFVGYVGSPGPSASAVQIDGRNSRQVLLKDNVLYASNGSTAIAAKLQSYGTLPTGATTPTALVTLTTSDVSHGFMLFDLSTSVAGYDTVYIVNAFNNQLLKYSFDGSTWVANGSLSITGLGQGNVDGYVDSGGVRLFLSTGSVLGTLFDTSGYNSTITGTFSPIATASANTAFRGLVVTVPEPGAWAMLALGLCGLLVFRRRN